MGGVFTKSSKLLDQSFFINDYKTYIYLTKFRLLHGIKVKSYI